MPRTNIKLPKHCKSIYLLAIYATNATYYFTIKDKMFFFICLQFCFITVLQVKCYAKFKLTLIGSDNIGEYITN